MNTSLGLKQAYGLADLDFRLKRSRFAIILTLILVPIFGVVDQTLYPNHSEELLWIRLKFEVVYLLFLAFTYSSTYSKHIKTFGVLGALAPILAILWMIMSTDGSASPYYAGLSLVVVAASLILPWTLVETLIVCSLTLLLYVVACMINPFYVVGGEFNQPQFINNLFFLGASIIFCVISSQYHSSRRKKLFSLNYALENQYKTLKETQSKLLQSEKLNALGSMSAGLLHEINNPLNYTTTALQLLKMEPAVTDDAEILDTVNDIDEGMARVRTIVSDLRAFAYPSEVDQHAIFNIRRAIEKSIRFTKADLQQITVDVQLDERDNVVGSESHVVQVIVNLLSNAARAIKSAEGKIEKGHKLITMRSQLEGDRLHIYVKDNGIGMDDITTQKIFDPFFTTREVGDGMGLGLSICHTILQNHGGELTVSSELGVGTEFRFDLGLAVGLVDQELEEQRNSQVKRGEHA